MGGTDSTSETTTGADLRALVEEWAEREPARCRYWPAGDGAFASWTFDPDGDLVVFRGTLETPTDRATILQAVLMAVEARGWYCTLDVHPAASAASVQKTFVRFEGAPPGVVLLRAYLQALKAAAEGGE